MQMQWEVYVRRHGTAELEGDVRLVTFKRQIDDATAADFGLSLEMACRRICAISPAPLIVNCPGGGRRSLPTCAPSPAPTVTCTSSLAGCDCRIWSRDACRSASVKNLVPGGALARNTSSANCWLNASLVIAIVSFEGGCMLSGMRTSELKRSTRCQARPSMPARRPLISFSVSAMMRSMSSFTEGMSLMRPATMPQLQAPASI